MIFSDFKFPIVVQKPKLIKLLENVINSTKELWYPEMIKI